MACSIDAGSRFEGGRSRGWAFLRGVMVMHGNVTCHVWERLLRQMVSNSRGQRLCRYEKVELLNGGTPIEVTERALILGGIWVVHVWVRRSE